MKGYIFVLSNLSMPGLVYVGHTNSSVKECMESAGVPSPFREEFSLFVDNTEKFAEALFFLLNLKRIAVDGNWFKASVSEVISAFDECSAKIGVPSDAELQKFVEDAYLKRKAEWVEEQNNVIYKRYREQAAIGILMDPIFHDESEYERIEAPPASLRRLLK